MNDITKERVVRLLEESIITPGSYTPTAKFLSSKSVGITIDGKPIMIVGYEGDRESNKIIDRLLASTEFAGLVENEFGSYEKLEKSTISNLEYCTGQDCNAITKGKQGSGINSKGKGQLVALMPEGAESFTCALCVSNVLMLCFYPNAIPLRDGISLF